MTTRPPLRPLSVRGIVGRFALAGFIAVAVVAAISAWFSQRAGRDQAIGDAREITRLIATGIVEPALTQALLTSDPAGVEAMDDVMRRSVIRGSLVRVKIWDPDGRIIYSDKRELIGQRFDLGEEELGVLSGAPTEAEVSDLTKPENRYERGVGKLLEAYSGMDAPDGSRLLFEGYFRYSAVAEAGRAQWSRFAPVSLGALLLLELVQIPIVWSVARRVRSSQRERELLLQNAIDSSDAERRRIASDLHDGVVQDLSGVSLSLAAMARRPEIADRQEAQMVDTAAHQVRESVKSLRSLLVEIYPANLEQAGLESALGDLLARCSNRGLTTSLECDNGVASLNPTETGLVYRGAQEALRNVVKHAWATEVHIRLSTADGVAALVVDDDGAGIDPSVFVEKPAAGHVGLRVFGDLVAGAGGELVLGRSAMGGTSFRMKVPMRRTIAR